jgi:hypothetical protein
MTTASQYDGHDHRAVIELRLERAGQALLAQAPEAPQDAAVLGFVVDVERQVVRVVIDHPSLDCTSPGMMPPALRPGKESL